MKDIPVVEMQNGGSTPPLRFSCFADNDRSDQSFSEK